MNPPTNPPRTEKGSGPFSAPSDAHGLLPLQEAEKGSGPFFRPTEAHAVSPPEKQENVPDPFSEPPRRGAGPYEEVTPEQHLAKLEAELRRHLGAAEGPPPEAVEALAVRLGQIAPCLVELDGQAADACLARMRRIRALHNELALRLTQRRDEAAAQLARVRKGKTTLKAYGRLG